MPGISLWLEDSAEPCAMLSAKGIEPFGQRALLWISRNWPTELDFCLHLCFWGYGLRSIGLVQDNEKMYHFSPSWKQLRTLIRKGGFLF